MARKKKGAVAVAAPSPPGVVVSEVVSANYAVKRPFGGGIFSTPRRYQIDLHEHEAISVISDAANEYPALRALADWAEQHGAPEVLLEAWESAKHGTGWACEGRPQPEGWRPYRNPSGTLPDTAFTTVHK